MKPVLLLGSFVPGKTFLLTCILLICFGGIAEWVARLDVFQALLTPPKMGTRHNQLGHKLALLDALVSQGNLPDCIMVGSSMVDVGFDPDAFQQGVRNRTGSEIHCFNFGIDSSIAVSTAVIARILIEDYRPRLLIVGTDPRDIGVPKDEHGPAVIFSSPWIRFRQGEFSPEGWLLEHSYFFRYRQHLSRLIRLKTKDTLWSDTTLSLPIRPNGFSPVSTVSTVINEPPDLQDPSYEIVYYTGIYSPYRIYDENLEKLAAMMEYTGDRTQVIVVEMPVSDGLYYFFKNGESDYNRYVTAMEALADTHQVPFWRTEPLDSIPDDGWSDYSHLNGKGAKIFSTWLGEQVGQMQLLDASVSSP
jgi:hypothetical protein